MFSDYNNKKQKLIHRPFRYDFFTIWGNGLSHKDDILNILRSERSIKIVRIESKTVKNMKKFVFDLYGCDTVPVEHLRAKLKYLFFVRPEILIVFVKNYNPQEVPAGYGKFRKVQCQNINRIKIKIRNQFNPRHYDKDFQIKPLGKGISHEHVIHASDYEEQVDYFLKTLGHKNGIKYLHGDSENLPFEKPYYLKTPGTYTYKTIMIEKLRASILDDSDSTGVVHQMKKIPETPHYRSLNQGTDDYRKYLERFKYTLLTPDYSWENFKRLNKLDINQIKIFDRIIVKIESDYYRILDGVHRAAVSLNHKLKRIKCVEFCY